MGELVPDTPRPTAEAGAHAQDPPTQTGLDSFSQSYLLGALGGQGAGAYAISQGGHSTAQSHSGATADDSCVEDDLGDLTSIADSQQLPPADDASTMHDSLPHRHQLMHTRSALVLGPDDHSGYSDPVEDDLGILPETQAVHSLDEDSWRRTSKGGRTSTGSAGSRRGQVMQAGDEDRTEGEAEDVSMDLTRAVGRVLPAPGDETGDEEPPVSTSMAPRPSESQKENPSPSHPSSRPPSNTPFSLRNSHATLDDTSGAPSSSPAVARELLARRSPKKPSLEEPASSADPDLSPSVFLSPERAAKLRAAVNDPLAELPDLPSSKESRPSGSMSGPETSTPAFANIPPPAPPVTAARTLPTLAFAPAPLDDPAPVARSSTLPSARRTTSTVDPGLFASAAAMKAPPPAAKKKRRDVWDGISQDTESARSSESLGRSVGGAEESLDLPQTVLHDEAEERTQASVSGSGAGAGGAGEETADMEVDGETPLEATVREDETAGADSLASTFAHGGSPAARPASTAADESSLEPLPRRSATSAPLFNGPSATASSASSSPGSRSPAKVGGADAKGKQRLSDISDLKSSMEAPSQVFEVPPTQADYDALAPSGFKTQDVQIDNSDRWHASFQNDTSTDSAATHARQQSGPPPGRELRRRPPPPSPSAHKPVSTSSSAPAFPADGDADESHAPGAGADLSTLPQATQHAPVPESSPEVPLARKRARSPAPAAVEHADAPHPGSSGGIVPDSDGPTQQEELLPPPRALFAGAGPSRKDKGKEREKEPALEVEPQPFYEHEFGGGFEEDEAFREGAREEDDEEMPAPKKMAKGKGKAKPKPKARASPAKPKPVVKKVAPAAKGKGKCKARAPTPSGDEDEEAPDALDLLEETNYSVLPTAKNVKARPARKAAPAPAPTVKKDKGKRRASVTPSIDEEDEEDVPSPRKKRKTAMTPVVEIPVTRRTSTTPTTATKKAPAKKASTTAAKGKKRASTASAPTPSPEPPVAGPSRLRSQSAERTVSPALTDVKPALKSRLLATAPFKRVLAFWRDDNLGYYPGTITGLVGGKFDVRFDDGSRGKILPDEIRRCELVEGDRVTYFGNEIDSETQRESLSDDVVVTGIERTDRDAAEGDEEEDGEKLREGLAADDIIVAEDAGGRPFRLQVSAIRICQRNAHQLAHRRLTDAELALFEGKERAKRTPLQRLELIRPPKKSADLAPMEKTAPEDRDRLFGRTAFIITSKPRAKQASTSSRRSAPQEFDKTALIEKLAEHGATVIDWQHLFTVNQPARDDAPPKLFFPRIEFEHIEEIFLLADGACTTSKYLVSLALGVPCLSKEYAVQAMAVGTRIDWRPYLLTAGPMRDLGTYGIGAQLAALNKKAYGLDSLAQAHDKGGVCRDKAFVVVMRKAGKNKADKEDLAARSYTILSLLACASARVVHFVASLDDARSATGYDYVFVEDDGEKALPAALARHKGLVNTVWLKQCVMSGRLLPAERMKEMEEA
ncbi:hypothetical protein JCM10450v2_001827 [Rhodotorula kratochvilovae]